MIATRIDVSKPLVLGALIFTTALRLEMVFEVVVNTVVWAAGLRLLGVSSRMARPPNWSEAENQ
jgi:hypothetical protein